MIENAYKTLYLAVLIAIGIAMIFTLIRSITGKRIVDRIIGVNMMCNEATFAIAVLALYLKESYLLDVCLIYVMLSFLAVLILCKVFITVYIRQHKDKEDYENDV